VLSIFTNFLVCGKHRPICKSKGKNLRFGNKKRIINGNLLLANGGAGTILRQCMQAAARHGYQYIKLWVLT